MKTDENITSVEARIQESSQNVRISKKDCSRAGLQSRICSQNFEKGSTAGDRERRLISQMIKGCKENFFFFFFFLSTMVGGRSFM